VRIGFFVDTTEAGVKRVRFQAKESRAPLHPRQGVEGACARRWKMTAGKELRAYFARRLRSFSVPCDLKELSPFTRAVLRTAAEIPYGEVRSYRWVAEHLGKPGAARAVGGALARNPIPVIIPCHRVVRSDQALGGYSLGLKWKRRLLKLETEDHNPLVNLQHLGNPGRREGGGCKAEQGIAPERTSAVREDASPKRQRSKRPLSTDQGKKIAVDKGIEAI